MAHLTLPVLNLNANLALQQFVAEVRDFMRDYPELNRLIEGEETSDRMIQWAIINTVEKFNITPPLIGTFTIETFPSRYLLLTGTASHVLKSAGLLYSRNQLDYSAGGVTVSHSNKTPLYMSWTQLFDSEWHQQTKALKVSLNIEQAYGRGIHSEYLFLNGFFGDF